MPLLCDRPHPRFIDFEASRFVVSIALTIGADKLERGEEVPAGVLDAYTLRCEYEAHRIELVSYVREYDPDLVMACASRGVSLEDVAASQLPPPASQSVPKLIKILNPTESDRTSQSSEKRKLRK
jgi:hypothetical protein